MRGHRFMRRRFAFGALLVVAVALTLGAATARSSVSGTYLVHQLSSDRPGIAANTDPDLVNGWGIVAPPTGPWWVADNGTDKTTLYDGHGVKQSLIVNILNGEPTGVVFNGGSGFDVTNGSTSGPALFIFAAESGTISGWNPTVDAANTLEGVTVPGAVYKGLALASNGDQPQLYATDFVGGKVDVFSSSWGTGTASGGFTDPNLPDHYAPFGIANIGGNLVVTFAKQEPGEEDELHGPGFGVVDLFDSDGNLLSRIATHGQLNAPWGVAMAPDEGFGRFSGDLLVGNFGDGHINAFAQDGQGSWRRVGALRNSSGDLIRVPGLWGIGFGNDGPAGSSKVLYFAAGPNDENDGLFGGISAN
jgi:uncharacterized protein (TIGR03118 family)